MNELMNYCHKEPKVLFYTSLCVCVFATKNDTVCNQSFIRADLAMTMNIEKKNKEWIADF